MVRHLPQAAGVPTFQFADDLTNSVSDKNLTNLMSKLETVYTRVKAFCNERNLMINLDKTQVIIFKQPSKTIPEDLTITLDSKAIAFSKSVKLLGVTLDQHLTMGHHIDDTVTRCHGLLGMLKRTSSFLPKVLLKLIYEYIVRSHLEYCSATFFTAAQSHLNKLDVIQKIAARIVMGVGHQEHSAPLFVSLGWDSLDSRRRVHLSHLVHNIMEGRCHPYFKDLFPSSSSTIPVSQEVGSQAVRNLHNKRFSNFGKAFLKDPVIHIEAPGRPVQLVLMGQSSNCTISHQLPYSTSSRSVNSLTPSHRCPVQHGH